MRRVIPRRPSLKKSAHNAGWEECAWFAEESTVAAAGWSPDLAESAAILNKLKVFKLRTQPTALFFNDFSATSGSTFPFNHVPGAFNHVFNHVQLYPLVRSRRSC